MKNLCKLTIALLASMGASAQDTATNSYTQTNLVSDISGMAKFTDPHLVNPWGLSRSASSFWWVSDEGTGVSTLYNGAGAVQSLVVTIPPATGTGHGTPTGTVALGSEFIFVTHDGTIQSWTGGTKAVIKVKHSGAVYTGCTTAKNGTVQTIYVANSTGGVEAYTTGFSRITLAPGAFQDSSIPAGYTPYGIQAVAGKIYVTFAVYPPPGPGGFVDVFSPAGGLLLRLAQGWFDEPWGIAQAPAGFGIFQHAVLVGNVGSGWIGAYNPTTGNFLGFLHNASKQKITIPGLWAIRFGGGNSNSGPTSSLYFAAGIDGYLHGLFGTITFP